MLCLFREREQRDGRDSDCFHKHFRCGDSCYARPSVLLLLLREGPRSVLLLCEARRSVLQVSPTERAL